MFGSRIFYYNKDASARWSQDGRSGERHHPYLRMGNKPLYKTPITLTQEQLT